MEKPVLFARIPEIHNESTHELAREASFLADSVTIPKPKYHRLVGSIAIDDESTCDVDDSMAVEELSESETIIRTSITDVASVIPQTNAIARYALAMVESVYAKNGLLEIPMLPERISHGVASLHPDQPRPVLTSVIHYKLGETPKLLDIRKEFTQPERMTKQHIALLRKGELQDPEALTRYRRLSQAALLLAKRREQRAGLQLSGGQSNRYKGEGDEIFEFTQDYIPPDVTVREFAIITNELDASFFLDYRIPMLFRVMGPSDERARYAITPLIHTALGVDLYTHNTSPLRRIADYMHHMNFDAFIHNKAYPFSLDFLENYSELINTVREHRRAIGIDRAAHVLKQYGFKQATPYVDLSQSSHNRTHNPKKLARHLFPKETGQHERYLQSLSKKTLSESPRLLLETLEHAQNSGAVAYKHEVKKRRGEFHAQTYIFLPEQMHLVHVETVDKDKNRAPIANMELCLRGITKKQSDTNQHHETNGMLRIYPIYAGETTCEKTIFSAMTNHAHRSGIQLTAVRTYLLLRHQNSYIYATEYKAGESGEIHFVGYGTSKPRARIDGMSKATEWLKLQPDAHDYSSLSSSIS
ncbi:MAG TPA: RNB domain-containing ribonuclease [Candidatus Saccharibacteria bacterium]|nr:RNB domain-containing ribonuclease [Candidatus Saccharibacteria bacterium]